MLGYKFIVIHEKENSFKSSCHDQFLPAHPTKRRPPSIFSNLPSSLLPPSREKVMPEAVARAEYKAIGREKSRASGAGSDGSICVGSRHFSSLGERGRK